MNRLLQIPLLFLFISFPSLASGYNYTALYSNANGLHIEDVCLTASGTEVSFRYEASPYSRFSISSTAFLVDEQCVRHPITGCKGILLDSLQIVPDNGYSRFSITFTAMAENTEWFDFIEGMALRHWILYGIHKSSLEPSFPTAKETVAPEELQPHFFQPDSVTIHGRIHGYSRLNMPHVLEFRYESEHLSRNEQTYPNCAMINEDGSFSGGFLMDKPTWLWIEEGWGDGGTSTARRLIPVFARPGDTVNVQIYDHGTWKERVEYSNPLGRNCLSGLMQLVGRWPVELRDFGTAENIGFAGLDTLFSGVVEQVSTMQDYLIYKYKLSPWESHLFKSEQLLTLFCNLLSRRSDIDEARRKCGLADSTENLPGDEYLNRFQWNDSSLLITPSMHSGVGKSWLMDRMEAAGITGGHAPSINMDDHGWFRPENPHAQTFIDSITAKYPTQYLQLIFLDDADGTTAEMMQRFSTINKDNPYNKKISLLAVIKADAKGLLQHEYKGFDLPVLTVPQETFIRLRGAFRMTRIPDYKMLKHDGTMLKRSIRPTYDGGFQKSWDWLMGSKD